MSHQGFLNGASETVRSALGCAMALDNEWGSRLSFPLAWLASESSSRDSKNVFPNTKPTVFYGRHGIR
jgi:hypothetical protein